MAKRIIYVAVTSLILIILGTTYYFTSGLNISGMSQFKQFCAQLNNSGKPAIATELNTRLSLILEQIKPYQLQAFKEKLSLVIMKKMLAKVQSTHEAHITKNDLPKDQLIQEADKLAQAQISLKKLEYDTSDIHIIYGQVVLEGQGDPKTVVAQMPILDEGYFIGPIKNLLKPIGFRLAGYLPYNLTLNPHTADFLVNVGIIHLKPVPANKLSQLKGKVILQNNISQTQPNISLVIVPEPINTPSNGYEPRKHWPASIKPVLTNSKFVFKNLAPIQYYFNISAPGYVSQFRYVDLASNTINNIGNITLVKPLQIQLSYYVTEHLPFRDTSIKTTKILGGNKWTVGYDDGYGWDLAFPQEGNQIKVNYFYAPCYIADLGKGNLVDYKNINSVIFPDNLPTPQVGHVYLMRQEYWKRWVLFKIDNIISQSK